MQYLEFVLVEYIWSPPDSVWHQVAVEVLVKINIEGHLDYLLLFAPKESEPLVVDLNLDEVLTLDQAPIHARLKHVLLKEQ